MNSTIISTCHVLSPSHREAIMFVCICNAVTDRQIKETVAAGATTLTDLTDRLGVANCCGCCADLASSFLGGTAANQHTAATASIVVEH